MVPTDPANLIELRVTLLDTWEEHTFHLPPGTLVTDLKRAALTHWGIRQPADEYEVKYNGARLDEGNRTLAEAGIQPNSALIVLSKRRRPAK